MPTATAVARLDRLMAKPQGHDTARTYAYSALTGVYACELRPSHRTADCQVLTLPPPATGNRMSKSAIARRYRQSMRQISLL